jgi:hypothetical protein
LSYLSRLVVVAHAETEDSIRIISARLATKVSVEPMSTRKKQGAEPEMREEYDFSNGVRGKYAERFAKGSNVIVLDPDVAEVFRDAKGGERDAPCLGSLS